MFTTLQQILSLTIIITIVRLKAEPPEFRILAPEFVCPKDKEATLVKPDSIIITIKTKAGAKLLLSWTVRWSPLPAPAQRATLLLWRATRALEKKLSGPQPEPFVYVIKNDELLPGVTYIFNVTASNAEGETLKSFHINNVQGDQKLEHIEGRADLLSVVLVGSQETYANVEFAVEALVTTCYPTQDYYFDWTIHSTETDDKVDTALTSSRLEIPANSLRVGLTYLVTCQILRASNGDFITQTDLPIKVLRRTFEVYLNVEHLTVPINAAFTLECLIVNYDYFEEYLTYEWHCTSDNKPCDFFPNSTTNTLVFENGLPVVGKYEVALTVSVHEHSASASTVIISVQHRLPIIQIAPLPRVLNEGTKTVLLANVSNVTPLCSLTWYFAGEQFLLTQNQVVNDSCDDCQHGESLTETLTIYSLEENFLDELTDFSNETEWRQVTAEMPAARGRARFVAECACSLTFACDIQGTVYADICFKLNGIPKANDVKITPESGSALETIFRVSTLAATDPDSPLYYTFYCQVGINNTLALGSYAEHMAVETILPYVVEGTEVWVEVCDVLGACSRSPSQVVVLSPGDGATVATLLDDTHAHIRRCELEQLQRIAVAAITTYKNAYQLEVFEQFCGNLLTALRMAQDCWRSKIEKYLAFLTQLVEIGCDATAIASSFFYDIPRTASDAISEGWTLKDQPSDLPVTSVDMYCFSDLIVCTFYAANGDVAGMQIALPVDGFTDNYYDMEETGFTKWTPAVADGENEVSYWTIQQYFTTEDILSSRQGRANSNQIIENGGVWVRGVRKEMLLIHNSTDAIVSEGIFTKQACIPWMGRHYYYKTTPQTSCTDEPLYPWFAIVESGELIATGFVVFGKLSLDSSARNWFEAPTQTAVKVIVPDGPHCLYDLSETPGLVTMHVYYVDQPWLVSCIFQ